MTILPFLPLVVGAALACAPLFPSESPATEHPHYPKVTKVAGVKGNVSVSWFTVPYNPEQVKKTGPNYIWNRGFTLETDVALKCGNSNVAAGTYSFGFQLDGEGKKWSCFLMPQEVTKLNRQLARIKRSGGDTSEVDAQLKELAEKGVKTMTLDTEVFKGKHAEHMNLYSINYGYKTGGRRSPDPISGVEGEYRISFGDLHIKFAFSEVFEAKKGAAPAASRRR